MKKVLPIFFLLIMLILAMQDQPTAQTLGGGFKDSNRLLEAYRQTGAKFEEYTVTGWIQLNQVNPEANELRNLAWQAAEGLGAAREELAENIRKDNGCTGVLLAGKLDPDTYVEILAKNMDSKSYMLITLYSKGAPEKLAYFRGKVNEAFNIFGQGAYIAVIIKGSVPGRLDLETREKLHKQIFTFLQAKKLEGISSEELVSWSGYSPVLPDRLDMGDKVINLNIASRYSSTTGSTVLLVGTPVISIEY